MNEHYTRANVHLKLAGITLARLVLGSIVISMVGFIILAFMD